MSRIRPMRLSSREERLCVSESARALYTIGAEIKRSVAAGKPLDVLSIAGALQWMREAMTWRSRLRGGARRT